MTLYEFTCWHDRVSQTKNYGVLLKDTAINYFSDFLNGLSSCCNYFSLNLMLMNTAKKNSSFLDARWSPLLEELPPYFIAPTNCNDWYRYALLGNSNPFIKHD